MTAKIDSSRCGDNLPQTRIADKDIGRRLFTALRRNGLASPGAKRHEHGSMSEYPILARELALVALERVLARHRPLTVAFDESLDGRSLQPRDRAFAHNLVATTLRRLGQIRKLIDGCLERPLPRAAKGVDMVLALGICQLLFLKTPAHAAVDTSVDLAAQLGLAAHRKLVNAVLRRLSREGEALSAAQDAPRLNTPDWLWRSWSDAYGEATCRAIAEAHLTEPPLDLTVGRDPESWAAKLGARRLPTGTLRLDDAGPIADLAGYDEGAWWVQDAAAALPARLLGDVAGKIVVDLCAAPGGKTMQLAAAGAEVIAVDRSAKRLERLTENLARSGLKARTVVADALEWRPDAPADAVLLDAPCSTTGTIRRHPDIQHAKTAKDVERLAALQARLLEAAAVMVKPGGRLIYCTCSLQPEEGPAQAARFLAGGAPFDRVPVTAGEVGGLDEIVGGDGGIRTLPCHLGTDGGMDGFYVARFVRR